MTMRRIVANCLWVIELLRSRHDMKIHKDKEYHHFMAVSPDSHTSLIILNRVTSVGFARTPRGFMFESLHVRPFTVLFQIVHALPVLVKHELRFLIGRLVES